jgi:hypothetical protein
MGCKTTIKVIRAVAAMQAIAIIQINKIIKQQK